MSPDCLRRAPVLMKQKLDGEEQEHGGVLTIAEFRYCRLKTRLLRDSRITRSPQPSTVMAALSGALETRRSV